MDFNTWWNTDETSNPNLKIYRGTVRHLLYLLSLSVVGSGGSYRIDGKKTGSGTLPFHGNYHLGGTLVELSEDDVDNKVNISFALNGDIGYQFDPTCTAGTQWYSLGSGCS